MTSDYHRAFVATFEGTGHDEREYAEAAIETAGAEPRFRPMKPAALIDDLPQYAYDFELIGQGLLLPVWALYRELRSDGVVVSLDGLGADELLMGYGHRLKAQLAATGSLLRSPLRTIDLARTVQQQFPERSFTSVLSDSDPILRALGSSVRGVKRFLKPKPGKPLHESPNWRPCKTQLMARLLPLQQCKSRQPPELSHPPRRVRQLGFKRRVEFT